MPPEPSLDRRLSDLTLAIDDLTSNQVTRNQLSALTDAVHDAANQLMLLNEVGEGIKGVLEHIAVALEATPDRLEAIAENVDKIWDDLGWALQNDRLHSAKGEGHLAEDAKAKSLDDAEIAQAKQQPVETALGPRAIEKDARQAPKRNKREALFEE